MTRTRSRRGTLRTALVAVAALPLTLAGSAVASAGSGAAPPATPQLVGVRASSHAGFDRVVWEFRGGLPATRTVKEVTTLMSDGEGAPVRIAGASILQVTMFQANGHDENTGTDTSPARLAPAMHNVAEIVQSGDFEAVVSYGVGLVKDQPYTLSALANPSRVVLDVRTDYAKAWRTVSFLDVARFAEGTPPYTVQVVRKVPALAPAGAVLHHLFAGPTAAEQAFGLATVRSAATGFRGLSISGGVAEVTLTGGCSSGGSTFTVADLITPTLKQFPSVRHVKVFDPAGRTARPGGGTDSVPACLEP